MDNTIIDIMDNAINEFRAKLIDLGLNDEEITSKKISKFCSNLLS